MVWHGDDMAQVKWHSCTTYMASCPTDAHGAWVQWDHHFLCGSTWELHIPIAPMDVPTCEHDVSPRECDVNMGGRVDGWEK